MGAQLSTVAPTATVPIDSYVNELGDLTYGSDLGRSRFLKTVRAVHRDGIAVVKVFLKPTTTQIDIAGAKEQVQQISARLKQGSVLNNFPNAIGYSRIVETDRAGYLVRQFIKHNLYDRISTRPFLEPIEKKWIAYQLLRGLRTCHENGIFHGDIKSENVLVGSWKWVYLVDFAPFKPVRLPETDSAQFLFYFDVSQRRTCYVAPERFADSGPDELTGSMDIYSAGCVIAELFLDGQPLFTLADLFKYKRGEYRPDLAAIDDANVRELILSMVSTDPNERLSAGEYLAKYSGSIFPPFFNTFWDILVPFSGYGGATDSNAMVQHMWELFETKILEQSLGCPLRSVSGSDLSTSPLPAVVTLPTTWWIPQPTGPEGVRAEGGALIILSYVCSSLKSTSTVDWRLRAAELVLTLAEFVPDDAKLDRCLPYLVFLTRDPQQTVRQAALTYVAHLLKMIKTYSPLNSKVFSEYLFPRLAQSVNSSSSAEVKATYAACLPTIAECAVECEGWTSVSQRIDENARLLLVDKVPVVRRSLLQHAPALCTVLGKQGTNDIFLSHAITYLNDKDPLVRIDLFEFIANVAPLVGPASVEQYVVPLMIQSLCDRREDLVAVVLKSLAAMVEVSLLPLKLLLNTVVPNCAKFLIHPNIDIRTQALLLVAATAQQLSHAQVYCLLRPILTPYLNSEIDDYRNPNALIEALRPPIPQAVYSLVLSWVSQATSIQAATEGSQSKSAFWDLRVPATNSTVSFSVEDRQWLKRLREVGFNNEDLWQLLAFRDYLQQLSRMPPLMPLPSELDSVSLNSRSSSSALKSQQNKLQNGVAKISVIPRTWSGGPVPPSLEKYVNTHQLKAEREEPRFLIDHKAVGHSVKGITDSGTLGTAVNGGTATEQIQKNGSKSGHQIPNVLVTSVKAHRGAIQMLAVHGNHRFFATGADDGIVKLWDARVLVKGSSRPVLTWSAGAPIRAGEWLADTSVLIVGTDDGKVHFIDCVFKSTEIGTLSFEGLVPVASYDLDGGYSVEFHPIRPHSHDKMVPVTDLWILQSNNRLIQLHLPNLSVKTTLTSPREHGAPTSWAWDPNGDWVIIGTLHGMMQLFDTRFGLLIQCWGIGDLCPITAIQTHPSSPKWICVAGGFERNLISVWDIQRLECKELLVPKVDIDVDDDEKLPLLHPVSETQKSLNERFAKWNIGETFARPKPPVTALSTSKRLLSHYLLSGGGDRMLRYWDLQTPHQSAVISGLNYKSARVTYMGKAGSNTKYTFEKVTLVKQSERLARTAIIGSEGRDIGRNHRGTITKVGLLETPGGRDMAVSVDEVGVVKVFF